MARSRQRRLVRRLEEASKVVRAGNALLAQMSGTLGQMSSLLRQLVMIVGWLVLLAGSVRLLVDPPPTLSLEHFLAPGAGAAAVAQGVVRLPSRWWRSTRP
ncbi:hypothetical protein [Sphaerisporangium perillae]|uniref:hypothetical protein n=1 Tax=Sphaerisporangium perillae TaxID=2935860 RepID=UPI00200E1969|nr:hypothetical protein [Sphaerisporangium perillae]